MIFRGINTDYFNNKKIDDSKKNLLYERWKIDKNNFIILLPGRLTSWKGQAVFIEAIKILSSRNDIESFNCIILGSDQGRNVYISFNSSDLDT